MSNNHLASDMRTIITELENNPCLLATQHKFSEIITRESPDNHLAIAEALSAKFSDNFWLQMQVAIAHTRKGENRQAQTCGPDGSLNIRTESIYRLV